MQLGLCVGISITGSVLKTGTPLSPDVGSHAFCQKYY